MKLLLYIFGGLGVFIFLAWYFIPYVRKLLFYLHVKNIANKMAKESDGKGRERMRDISKNINHWIKNERMQ